MCGFDDATGQAIEPQRIYRFLPDYGLSPDHADAKGVPLSGALLMGLREPQALSPILQLELRQVLDHLWQMLLKGKNLIRTAVVALMAAVVVAARR